MVFNFLFSLLTILIPLSYRKTRTYLKVGYVINIIQFSYFIMVWYIAYCIEKDQHRIIRLTNENYRLEGIIHNLNRNEEIIPINNWSDIKMDSKCSLDIKNYIKLIIPVLYVKMNMIRFQYLNVVVVKMLYVYYVLVNGQKHVDK